MFCTGCCRTVTPAGTVRRVAAPSGRIRNFACASGMVSRVEPSA